MNKQVEKLQLDGTNEMLDDGLYYFIPISDILKKVEKKYRKKLGIN